MAGWKIVLEDTLRETQAAVGRVGPRQQAIGRARRLKDGRFGELLIDGRIHYVVYSRGKPVDLIPASKRDVRELIKGYDPDLLRDPDELSAARARKTMRSQWQAFRTKLGPPELRRPPFEGASRQREGLLETVLADMPRLLDELRGAQRRKAVDGLPPVAGVYLLSEQGMPLYVGQSGNVAQSVRRHGAATSRRDQAPLAFNLARHEADSPNAPEFGRLFSEARERVRQMDVQVLELKDLLRRHILEPYATRVLGTVDLGGHAARR